MGGETLRKIGTLGGPIRVRKDMKRYYYGEAEPGGPMSKERLFGMHGPLLFGMPRSSSRPEEVALHANIFDTRADLVREIVENSELTRQQAQTLVGKMLASGQLAEVNFEGRKVLVWGGNPR